MTRTRLPVVLGSVLSPALAASLVLAGCTSLKPGGDIVALPDASAADATASADAALDAGADAGDDAASLDAGADSAALEDGEAWATLASANIQTYVAPVGGVFLPGRFDATGPSAAYDGIAYVFSDSTGYASIDVISSNGTSFSHERRATHVAMWQSSAQWIAGDYNGDGFTDLVEIYPDSGFAFEVVLWTPTGFELAPSWPGGGQGWVGGSGMMVSGHFLGNCTSDLALVVLAPDDPHLNIDIWSSNGSSFTYARVANLVGSWPSPTTQASWAPVPDGGALTWTLTPPSQWTVGDFDGDGRDDIVITWYGNRGAIDQTYVDAYYSTTAAPDAGVPMTFTYQEVARGDWQDWEDLGWYFPGDIDGDGRTDLVYAYSDTGATLSIDSYLYRSSAANSFLNNPVSAQTRPFPADAQFFTGVFTHPRVPDGGTGVISDIAYAHPVNGEVAIELMSNFGQPAALCGVQRCGADAGIPSGSNCP